MTLHPVKSTSIKAVGYDPATKTMRIQFHHSDMTYDFLAVEPHEHKALLTADSIGRHFGQHIQPKHNGTRVKT